MNDSTTRAAAMMSDERYIQAKQLMLEVLNEHREKITAPSVGIESLKADYDKLLNRFADLRGGGLYYPYLGSGIGNGALVELADGSVKFDMITGIGVHGFGHSHPDLIAAVIDGAVGDTIMQGNLQQNVESESLSEMLIEAATEAGSHLKHCFLTTSGAMANENALKMIFQKKQPADRVLAFEHCFMGRTMVMSQITDKAANRVGLPPTLAVDYVPFFDPTEPAASTRRALDVLQAHLRRYPGRHAAMCFELVQGEGGFNVGDHEFFLPLIEMLREHDVAVFFDEIQTFGRTSHLFAFKNFDLAEHADVVTIGKLSQVCATLFTDDYIPQPGLISQTFTGATSSIRAGQCILRHLMDGDFYGPHGRIAKMRDRFLEHFKTIREQHPNWIAGPHGIGGMIAMTVFDGTAEMTKKTLAALYDVGVIAFVAGSDPARIRFLPPFAVITDDQIDAVCKLLEKALAQVADEM